MGTVTKLSCMSQFNGGFVYYFTAYFSCIVKVLYNLLYFQVVAQLSCHMTEQERAQWHPSDSEQSSSCGNMMSLDEVMALVIGLLEETHLYQLEDLNCSIHEGEMGSSMAVSFQGNRDRVELQVCVCCFILFWS